MVWGEARVHFQCNLVSLRRQSNMEQEITRASLIGSEAEQVFSRFGTQVNLFEVMRQQLTKTLVARSRHNRSKEGLV